MSNGHRQRGQGSQRCDPIFPQLANIPEVRSFQGSIFCIEKLSLGNTVFSLDDNLNRLSENWYFSKFSCHKSFNIIPDFLNFAFSDNLSIGDPFYSFVNIKYQRCDPRLLTAKNLENSNFFWARFWFTLLNRVSSEKLNRANKAAELWVEIENRELEMG